jgi:hypothetical protein
LAHFKTLVPRKREEDYLDADPPMGKSKPLRGFSDLGHFRTAIDLMEHALVIVCWYSRWIMAGRDRIYRHLPKRVLRLYDYVQTIPLPPTRIAVIELVDVVLAFMEFVVHVLSQQDRGDPVPEDEVWNNSKGYMNWFYKVSHPLMITHAVVPDYTAYIPPYEEVRVEQQWARQPPNPFQIIGNIRARVESAMGHHDVFSNPVVAGIMDGIRSEYNILQDVPVPRRRSKSHSPQEQ